MNLRLAICTVGLALAGCASTAPVQNSPGIGPAEVNVQLGVGYLERGQYEVALQKLRKALEQNPDLVSAHTTIAVVYEEIGWLEQAESHYQRAVDLNENDGMAQMNLATYLCKRGHYEKSEAHFLAALRDPFYKTPELALTNAGICMARTGALPEAERYLRRALKINPRYPSALIKLSRVTFERQDYLSARAFLQRYSSVAPVTPASLYLGALIETRLGDSSAAAGYARSLNAQFPDSPEAARLTELAVND